MILARVVLQICCWQDSIGLQCIGERGGSVVECRTPEREVRGSRPTAAVLCPWARHFTPRKYWLITQEAMAPSRYDWKIVDWDVKPQHNQQCISREREILQPNIYRILPKVNQATYTLTTTCVPNIMILAQLSGSPDIFLTRFHRLAIKDIIQSNIHRILRNVYQVVCIMCPNSMPDIRIDPSQCGSPLIFHAYSIYLISRSYLSYGSWPYSKR